MALHEAKNCLDNPVDDADLMQSILEGDSRAANLLVDRYQTPLVRLLFSRVGNLHLAEDLAQETWIKVFGHAESYDMTRKFSTWLFAIAANVARDNLRKHRVPTVPLDRPTLENDRSGVIDFLAGNEEAPLHHSITEDQHAAVMRAMPNLKPAQQKAITAYVAADFSRSEAAEMTQAKVSTFNKRLERGFATIRGITRAKALEVIYN